MNTSSQIVDLPTDSLSEEIRTCWRLLPNKGFFFGLIAAWLLLFHFYGNTSLGYISSTSLFQWMSVVYNADSVVGDDGHGNFIPLLVMGLLWCKRKELLALPLRNWWPGLLLIAFGLMFHIVGYMVQQQRISIVGLFTGIYGLTGLVWGPRWLKATFFPFFLFAFMVPLGSLTTKVTFPLQMLVTWLVEHFFNDVLGINVVRIGTQLLNPIEGYTYDVAPACGGIRSLISIFLISVTYGFLVFRSPWRRLAMVVTSLPLAVIGNAFRLSMIVAAAEWRGQEAGKYVHDSGLFSLLPYVPAIIGVMMIGRWLEKSEGAHPVAPVETKPV